LPQLHSSLTRAVIRWKPLLRLPRSQRPPTALYPWLADKGSLTARLVDLSQGQFKVEILRQYLGKASRNEQGALGIGRQELCLIREVILWGKGEAWIFARSLLPLRSLTGKLRHLRKQDQSPLGAFLFSQPQLARSPIAVAPINAQDQYFPSELALTKPLWGRRSIFYLAAKPLLVSEVFLPALCARIAHS